MEPQSYEDFQREYDGVLSKVRSKLSSTRTLESLRECEVLLQDGRRVAHAMQGLAEVEGDEWKVQESRRRIETEIQPLTVEVTSALEQMQVGAYDPSSSTGSLASSTRRGYAAPQAADLFGNVGVDMSDTDRLLQDSESLIRESQMLAADSEQVGSSTLQMMSQQREQLNNASTHIERTRRITEDARRIMREMSSRALRSKIFLYCVIFVLIVANLFAFIRLFRRR